MKKPIYLDVMLNGRFICQLRYDKPGFPRLENGEIVECHDHKDLEAFVLEKRPSLKGKNYSIEIAQQQIFK